MDRGAWWGYSPWGHKDMTEHTHIWRRVKLKHKRLSTKTELLDASEVLLLLLYLRVSYFFQVVSQGLFKIKISIGRKLYALVSQVDYGRLLGPRQCQ